MRFRRMLLSALCLIIALSLILPLTALADEAERKVVRVGWYESAFHRTDQFGRKSGYGYEYQQRVATYTGWEYEYVEDDGADASQSGSQTQADNSGGDWEYEYVEDDGADALQSNGQTQADNSEGDWEWEYVDENGNPTQASTDDNADDGDWEWEYVDEDEAQSSTDKNNPQ